MITRTTKLKIAGLVGLVLLAGVSIKLLWPAKTVEISKPDTEKSGIVRRQKRGPDAEQLYKMATLQKEKSVPAQDVDYTAAIACCRQILKEFPDSPQAEKARHLLQQIPQQHRRQYDRQMSWLSPSKPKVKKSRPLRRPRMPRRYHQRRGITIEETASSS